MDAWLQDCLSELDRRSEVTIVPKTASRRSFRMSSSVEIMDIASRHIRAVYRTDSLVEAPNWSPDGKSLVINGDGSLFRLNPDGTGNPRAIETEFAKTCNNDHGISPDGTLLVISDETETGASQIYTLPFEGGQPTLITSNQPSYWHGWSPDGRTLAYCAKREEAFDIYTIPVSCGTEQRLTDGPGHKDGPDYSPCGCWIYFNSSASGSMQIWRMEADGSNQMQITQDARTNWFPHPSPTGDRIVYLSYASGVVGHPRNHFVQLKMMDMDGGNVVLLNDLFGGQGTINVPSWSPDGTAFAFVRYTPRETRK